MLFKDNEKILFTGDSVTDAGRARPVGMNAGLGNAYVAVVNNMLNAFYPELRLPVYNTGVSGNTSRDLAARWRSNPIPRSSASDSTTCGGSTIIPRTGKRTFISTSTKETWKKWSAKR